MAGRWRATFVEPDTATARRAALRMPAAVTVCASDRPACRAGHDRAAGLPRQPELLAGAGDDSRRVGNGQAERLGDHRHAVAGVGTRAATRPRHLRGDQPFHVRVVDQAAPSLSDRLEDRLPRHGPALVIAHLGRPGVDAQRRDAGAQGAHDHPGRDLVSARDQHDGVERVRLDHHLDAVGDQLARRQDVAHSFAGHRDDVGRVDDVELERRATGRAHARLDRFRDRSQVDVLRGDLVPRVGDRDQGPLQLAGRATGARVPAPREDPVQPGMSRLAPVGHGEDSMETPSRCQQS